MGEVLSLSTLAARVEAGLMDGKTLVTTNGCFDLLHVGHLRYLQAARDCGDCLLVALNADISVQRLKGPERPIIPEAERAELLAGLSCVDYVVIFEEPTPEVVLRTARPQIHVKGAQYSEATLPEAPLLRELGTEMRWIPMVAGRSTSEIVAKIRTQPSAQVAQTVPSLEVQADHDCCSG
ncbi:MAG: adenylyltransferase/cytidyltransferase family protein [Candidatus Melainabacteria bacterium]|nr:adenylyltransferase/cytidyltransferase family protein [Candidatus Melainabacteria bacterium]